MKQQFLLLLLCFVFTTTNGAGVCNHKDAKIYKRLGVTFPKLFRSFGGLTVSKSEYTERIVREVHLSEPCALCYADAYICGWDNCFWACKTPSLDCDQCLVKNDCVSQCEKCTGLTQK